MLNIVIFGGPGSGKGTQSTLIVDKFNVKHLSTGDLLRAEIKAESELGKMAQAYISEGALVPDEMILKILAKAMDEAGNAKGVIFDGFPRTVAQAEALDEILANRGESISIMLDLQVPDEILKERMLYRAKTSGRSDDNPETAAKRIAVYHNVTAPVIDYYKKKGLYVGIEGTTGIEAIFAEISKKIEAVLS